MSTASLAKLAALAAALLLSACSTTPPAPVRTEKKTEFTPDSFSQMPAIAPEDWAKAFEAFCASCARMRSAEPWREVCIEAEKYSPESAEVFFQTQFTPWRVEVVKRDAETEEMLERDADGLMTGYYEPLLYGSRQRKPPFVHPIYGTPDDLLVIDLASLYPKLKGMRLRGKVEGRRVVPYDDRAKIQKRKDLERWAIAWVDDPVDAFFLQIQGSGRIQLPDGSHMRVGFADQNGYKYHSIGNWLVRRGYLKRHELSMQKIRAWAKSHPKLVDEALAQNPSYVFFEERRGDPSLGPEGAQGVPLTPGASVAVDPSVWRLGTPFIVSASQENPSLRFTRPVVAQDTGGAIRGVIRFDYFWGFGDEAGQAAGRQRSRAQAWVLVPAGFRPEDMNPRRPIGTRPKSTTADRAGG